MFVSFVALAFWGLSYGNKIATFEYSALCGRGSRNTVEPYSETQARSRNQCIVFCSEDEKCTGVNYYKEGTCELFDDIIGDCSMHGITSSPDVTFYQQRIEEPCKNGGTLVSGVCKCVPCWAGEQCDQLPADCTEAFQNADPMYYSDEHYFCNIRPRNTTTVFQTQCLINHGGWTFIQYRYDCIGESFNQHWLEYKNGFGSDGCFWLGEFRENNILFIIR